MKKYRNVLSVLALAIIISGIIGISFAAASVTPTVTLTSLNGTSAAITIHGDANSPVDLHYGAGAVALVTIGTTDANGNVSVPISNTSYNIGCGQIAYVVINGHQSTTIPWSFSSTCSTTTTNSTTNPSFSQNNVVINMGQTQIITINGTGGYTISANTNPSVISANLSSNSLNLTAIGFGGANITVCESDAKCGTISAVGVSSAVQQTSNVTPAVTSFSISSNNGNGQFAGAGNVLTISVTFNQALTNVLGTIGSSQLGISGNGSSQYTTTYTMTGNESLPIPIHITYTNPSGNSGEAYFGIGNVVRSSVITPPIPQTPSSPTSTPTPAPASIVVGDGYTFTKFLSIDSTGTEVSELQKRLAALGFYSGPVTGKFGSLTQAAVIQLQKAHSIAQAGYVGPSTRAILNQY